MARWSSTSRRRLGGGAAGLVLAALAAGCTMPYVTSGPTEAGEQVLVCESGRVDQGGVHTSSAVATRVAAGSPVPPGCRLA